MGKIKPLIWSWRLDSNISYLKKWLVKNLLTKLFGRIFLFDQKVMAYTRQSTKQKRNDFLMRVSALFLRVFIFKTLPKKYLALGQNAWMQGKHQKALMYFLYGERARISLVKRNSWEEKNFIILPRNCAQLIGLMGHLDAFVKRKILTRDSRTYYLLTPESDIVNKDFLNYWSPYIDIIIDPKEIQKLSMYEPDLNVNWNWAIPGDDGMDYVHYGMAKIQRQWYTESRKPLLILSQSHRDLVENQKKIWGMKEEDWFICLHIRSQGYHAKADAKSQDFRNTSIEDYYPMINSITESGGWVIRMGDHTTLQIDKRKLRHSKRVIDYAHMTERSSALDVALSATCRLFVSSPSGLHAVAKSFGVPALYINYPFYRGFPHDPNSIFVPPFYYSHIRKRILTLREILSSDLVYADHQCHFNRSNISLQYVQPDDMVIAVQEALSITKNMDAFLNQNRVENDFDHINKEYNALINGRIGTHFLEKYSAKLGLIK